MIPEAAVEAAARTSFERTNPRTPWPEVEPHWKAAYLANMRAALEAAAPHMLAEAKAGALEEAAQDFEDNIGVGEFDEQARHDGGRWNHIEESWEHQGPYMDWLRARAAYIRSMP